MNDREITMLVNSLVDRDEWGAVECIRALQSRLESLEKDAARYRWCANQFGFVDFIIHDIGKFCETRDEVDSAIDTAMQANKGE